MAGGGVPRFGVAEVSSLLVGLGDVGSAVFTTMLGALETVGLALNEPVAVLGAATGDAAAPVICGSLGFLDRLLDDFSAAARFFISIFVKHRGQTDLGSMYIGGILVCCERQSLQHTIPQQ